MTSQVADNYVSSGARLVGEMQTTLEAWQSIMEETLGGASELPLTIATDIVLVPNDNMHFTVDTEGFLGTDNLSSLNGASPGVLRDGHFIMIRNFNAGRIVVVKHGVGNIQLNDGRDYSLASTKEYLSLVFRGTTWYEVKRSDAAFVRQLVGALQETTLVIATGNITPTLAAHQVDTEAAAPTDDLTNIIQTSLLTNFLIIRSTNAARVVTVKNASGGAGQIFTADTSDIILDALTKYIFLYRQGAAWYEINRSGFPAIGTHLRTLVSAGASTAVQSGFRSYVIDTVAIAADHTLNMPNVAASANSHISVKILGDFQVIIDPQGAQLVDGLTTRALQGDGSAFTMIEDGTQWRII